MPRLFLLDGMALLYRAHFALIGNPIRNSKGVNTSALYGFTNTLLFILENERPTHLGVVFDTPAPTPRHLKFPAYKAQREAMPEELAAAIPPVKELCRAFRIPVIEMDGFEADDLIGTLARRAEKENFETFMVTSDKDFAQLVSDRTFMWRPGKGGSDHEVIGPAQLPKIWGVAKPEQIIDLLGMMGDASDNIPGIPGIGPKTAQKFIAEFGSLENLLKHTDQLKGKQRERVEENADQARLSKDLATILTDAPVNITWHELALEERNDAALKALFQQFEFRTLARRLFGEAPTAPRTVAETAAAGSNLGNTKHDYRLATTPAEQEELFRLLEKQDLFCFDIESTSLDRFEARLLGIAFSWKPFTGWFLPYSEELLPRLRQLFARPATKLGHNLKYDLSVLLNHGIEVAGPFLDTMLVDALVAPERRHSMDHLAESLLHYTTVKLADIAKPTQTHAEDDLFSLAANKRKAKDLDVAAIPVETLAEYAAEDADVTLRLWEKLSPQLEESGQAKIFHDIEAPLLPVLVRMEMEGIRLDPDALSALSAQLDERLQALTAEVTSYAGEPFNLNSPKQLGEILFDQLRLIEKPAKTKTGQYKTDEQTLAALVGLHPIIDAILDYRELAKLKSTYIDALPAHIQPATARIHTCLHQLSTATGRLASSEPNLQNIPTRTAIGREIRRAFIPREGFLMLSCDYSQIELRVMAALARDARMIADFQDGKDIHMATAARVFGVAEEEVTADQRRQAKMVNFGIIYGISAFGLSQRLGIPRTDAAAIIDNYFLQYPAVKDFMETTIARARDKGWAETLTGRRRSFPHLKSANATIRSNAERAAINTPIQGTAADMIKLAMIHIDALLREAKCRTRMLLQIHDELIFDLHPEEQSALVPQIRHCMETALALPGGVPVLVSSGTGPSWLDAH